MGYLSSELRSKKILDVEVEISDFIKEKGISSRAMIFAIEFDKKVFKTEAEVREWLQGKYYYVDDVVDSEGTYAVNLISTNNLSSNVVEIELRRGVKVFAADYMLGNVTEYMFNDKSEVMLDICLADKKVSEKIPEIIPLAMVVKGTHPTFGEINITREHLKNFVTNFNDKVVGTDLAINEDHKKNEAFAWVKEVFLSEDGNTLLGKVKWNKKGTKALNESEYRYFSPEFRLNYVHPHNGKEYGPTLVGGALTNYPFLKMDAITTLNDKSSVPLTKEKTVSEKTISLKDHEDKVVELSTKNNELNLKLVETERTVVELSSKIKTMEENATKAARESANKKLFDDGTINAAQLIALNEGKSTFEVLALSGKMNTKAAGGEGTKVITLDENEKAIALSLGLTDEEFLAGKV